MRAVLVLACAVACGDNVSGPTVIMVVGDDAPSYGSAPFPTDAVREPDGTATLTGLDRLAGAHTDIIAAHVGALDGFGVRPVVELFVDGPLAAESVTGHVIDLERGDEVATEWTYDAERGVIAGAPVPGVVLREGASYAAVVTTAVRAASGAPLRPARALAHLDDAPARWRSTADAYAQLSAGPALGGKIAGLAVFTTQRATAGLRAARERLAAELPPPALAFPDPALVFDTPAELAALLGDAARHTTGPRAGTERWGSDNPTGMAHDSIGVVATGTMEIARFRGDDAGTDGPDDETFQLDATGAPRVVAIEPIPVTVILPASAPPPAGFPVVIFAHGFGGSRHEALNLAEPLASRGYAILAIDMWGHGSRYDPADARNNLADKPGFTGDPDLRDGFGDEVGLTAYLEFFEGFLNIGAVRDAMRQSAVDFTRLAMVVQRADLDLTALAAPYGAPPKLDPRRVALLGQSFGTIVGAAVAAVEPSITLYVLDVPGGGLVDQIFTSSATVGSLALPLMQTIYRTRTRLDRFDPLLSLLQTIFDGADPLSYAPYVLANRFSGVPPRSVVCLEVIGDEILSNPGTEALARALGLAVLQPSLDVPAGLAPIASPAAGNRDGQTAVLVQYAPATHGRNWSAERGTLTYVPGFPHPGDEPYPKLPAPITIPEPIYETLDQVLEILDTHHADEPPRVRSTKPPVRDFDADGVPDDVDPAPHDPAN